MLTTVGAIVGALVGAACSTASVLVLMLLLVIGVPANFGFHAVIRHELRRGKPSPILWALPSSERANSR